MKKELLIILTLSVALTQSIFSDPCNLELLAPEDYTLALPFFADFHINEPILYSILEQKNPGKVLTDNRRNPSFVLIYSPGSYTFLAGSLDQLALQAVASYLKTLPRISLVCPLGWEHRAFFEAAGFTAVERIQFRRSDEPLPLDSWKESLAAHYSIEKIDHKNFDLCTWRSFMLSLYGNKEQFYGTDKGFCIVDEGRVISESFALTGGGKAEIAVVTNENYRGQNLGTIVSAVMLKYCYQHGIEPLWSCDACNPASISIAKKLGFKEEGRYFFLKRTA